MLVSTKRRLQQNENRPTIFVTDNEALDYLARIFNESDHDKTERISQLVRDINEVSVIASEAGYPSQSRVEMFDSTRGPIVKEIFRRIDSQLSELKLSPTLNFPTPEGWSRGWRVTEKENMGRTTELIFCGAVVDLAAAGLLSMLRECLHCKKWFRASRKDHQFCTENCRVAHNRKTSGGRAKRTVY